MMKISAQRTLMAGLSITAIMVIAAGVDGKALAADSTPVSCEPILSDEARIEHASQCIMDIISKLGDKQSRAAPSSSYALGVRFQSEVASEFETLDYAQFLLGVLDQEKKETRYPDRELNTKLQDELLSTAEKSIRFVKEFSGKPNVVSWKGVYYIDRSEKDKDPSSDQPDTTTVSVDTDPDPSGNEPETDTTTVSVDIDPDPSSNEPETKNSDCLKSSSHQYVVQFLKLKLDNNPPEENPVYECVSVDEHEVIRGWRTALEQMDEGNTWELVVPAPLAYGHTGTGSADDNNSFVEADEALRFLIRLHKKN